MPAIVVRHTGDLSAIELSTLHDFLTDCFDGDYADTDFDHALGGAHALAFDAGRFVAHGAVVLRRLIHGGRTWRTGYVESVAVRRDQRRTGLGDAVMAALENLVLRGFDLGALAASDDGVRLYERRGWQRWVGPRAALTPDGVRPTGDDDEVFVLPGAAPLDPTTELICDWRPGSLW